MTMFRAVEQPDLGAGRRRAFDALVIALAAACAVPAIAHVGAGLHLWMVLVVVAQLLPLLLRRIWPMQVFLWVLVVAVVVAAVNRDLVVGAPLLIGLYTVASTQPRRYGLSAAGLLEAAIIAASILTAGSRWWYDAIVLTGFVVAALGLGLYATTHRAYLRELHDRADRLERDRDQQIALAAAAERARIAREMHDIVAHHLTMMVALSDGAIAASAASPERATEVMRTVSATGRRALNETRRLVGVLRESPESDPDALRPIPDLSELDALISRVRAAGLPTSLEVHGSEPGLSAGIQLTAYRLVQEALTNTLKHAGPHAHAVVRLNYLPDELHVDVEDDGIGAAARGSVGVGSGLVGMRERINAFGGDVRAEPLRNRGWRVRARLRLTGEDAT